MSRAEPGRLAAPPFPFGDWGFDLAPGYTRVRAAAEPACPVTTVTGDRAWLVTRHDLARRLLGDPRLSLTAALEPQAPRMEPIVLRAPNGTGDIITLLKQVGLHRVMTEALGPRATREHRPWAREQAERMLAETIHRERSGDLLAGLSLRFPFAVVCRILLGEVDERDLSRLNDLAATHLSWGPPHSQNRVEELIEAGAEIYYYFLRHLPELLAAPGEHAIKRLAAPNVLEPADLAVFATLMFLAGYRTSVSFLSNAMITLLRHPDALAAVRADPALVPTAVEELLRFTPMATGGAKRLVMADIDLDGPTSMAIRAGELIIVSLEAANRDPHAFADPETFDPARDGPAHLGFGFGAHFCPGNRLARMQIEIIVRLLADHRPALRLSVPTTQLRWHRGAAFRMPYAIPVSGD